ncbi:hypothetical protein HDU88_003611 [Geranomyces variabilis]|nr:hypothetical protein HDU88_003611 [Geranomyces variabilis]
MLLQALVQQLLLLGFTSTALARFAPATAYTYQVRSFANTRADFEKTILSAGGAPASAVARAASSYVFNADVEIAAYNVTEDGLTLCKVSFLTTPELVLGDDGAPRHHGSGALDFHANWFGFAVRPNGVVDHIIYSPDESPSVLAMKRGLVSHFSAPVNTPTGGPKKRSFSEDEPSQFGDQVNSHYDVEVGNETITYRKRRASLARRANPDDPDDQSRVDHVGDKTLVKDAQDGHLLSISVDDRATLKGSFGTERKGKLFEFLPVKVRVLINLRRRDSNSASDTDTDTDPEPDALMSAWGLSNTAFISKTLAVNIDPPPAGLSTGPVFAVPPPHFRPLKVVMPVVRENLKCFDGSIVNSQTGHTTGEKAGCFANARQALSMLNSEDALIASDFLMSAEDMGSSLWLGFDLPSMTAMARFGVEPPWAFKLGLNARYLRRRESKSSNLSCYTTPGSDAEIAPTLVDHAALLLGYLGLQLQKLGNTDEAAAITSILLTALDHPARKLARRSPESRDFGEAPEDEHFQQESIQASHAAARRATLILAIGHTEDLSTVATLRAAIFDAEAGYHPVVKESALDALGKLSGAEVENTLVAVLISEEHVDVAPSAMNALRARDRTVDIEQIALGAEELQQMYTYDSMRAGPLSERALRARDVTDLKVDLVLAAPSFLFDKKLGADLVGVRLVAHAINQVKLFLSVLMSDFAITIDNLATAALYIDLGSYMEMNIFRAQLTFIGEISYNANVLHDFKLSDVANFKQMFEGWIHQVQEEFTTVKNEISAMWNQTKATFDTLKATINTLASTDWSSLFGSVPNLDEELAVILDIFQELKDNVVSFAVGIQNDVLNAIDSARTLMNDAISLILGGFDSILECPEKSVAAILQAIEDVHQIALLLQNSFHTLESKCSLSSLENLLPAVDEDFGEYVNETLSEYPELNAVTELYNDFETAKTRTEESVNAATTAYSAFRVKLTELVALYNKLKSYYDATFGPKADSAFPNVPASLFPAETLSVKGHAYQGMSVKAGPGTNIVAPFAGKVSVVDEKTLQIEVTESSLKTYVVYVSNVLTALTQQGPVKKGASIGSALGSTIGLFIYGGQITKESVDPRKYLSRSLPIKNPFIISGNTYGMRVLGKDIVPFQAIIKATKKDDTQKGGTEELSGDTGLAARAPSGGDVCADPRFANLPQVCFNATIAETPLAMELYKYEELMFLAGIPITFSLKFDAVMGISTALSLCLTDLTVAPTLTPHFAIRITGFAGAGVPGLNVGVTATGTVADTRLPITPHFPLAAIPAGVCLAIDVIIVPLSISLGLSVTILIITYSVTILTVVTQFTMDPITLHILQTCPTGPAKKDQVGYLVDSTAPVVTSSTAYQLPNESVSSPFILARFASHDNESGMSSVAVGLGWSPADMQIVPPRVIPRDQGDSWTIPMSANPLFDERTLFINVIHTNMQNLTTTQKNSSLTISSTALPANTSITICMNATSNSKPVSIVSTCTSTILPKRVVFDRSCVNSGVTYNALQDGDQRATGSLWADWAKCSLADTAIVNFWLVTSADFQMIYQGSAQVKDGGVSVNLGISWPSDLYKFCFMSMTTTDLITNNFCLGEQLVDPIPPQSTGRFCDAYSGRGLDPTAVPVRTSSNFVQYLVRWDTWASSPSGIANFTVTLEGTAPKRTVSTAVVPAEETAYLFQNLSLTADEFYYATLSSTNSAGLSSRVIKSPGVVVSDISSRTPVINVYGGTLIQQLGQAVVLFRARNQTSMHVTWGGFRGDAAQVPNFMLQLVSWTASPTIPPYNYRATQHDAVVPIPGLAGMYNLSVTSVNLDGTELISTFPSPIRVAGGTSISPPATLHCDVDFSKFDPVRKTLPFSASWSGISDPEHSLVMQRLGFRRVGETSRTSSMTSLDLLATSATGILQYVYGPPTILDHWTSIECVYEAEDLSGDFISAVYNGSTHDAIAASEPAVLTLSAWTDMSLPSSETDFAFFADISVTTNSTFMIGLQSFPPIIRDGVQIANLSYSIHSADPMAADDGPSTIIVPPTPVYGSRQHISQFQVLVGSTLLPITLFSPIAFVEQGGVQHDMSTVYVCATAYTAHPNKTVSACSTGIMKDTVSPVAGSVFIEAVDSDRTTRYITDTEISISWSGFIKPNWPYTGETGISEYTWGIGSYSGADDYASFTKVSGNDQNAKVTAVLADGAIIYATVLASDHAGRTVSAISSPVIVDTTAPVSASSAPTVLAKSNLDGTVFVRASFEPFVDGESGVSSVLWTVETAYGAEDVLPPQIAIFYNVAYATLPLPPDATYLLRIVATNGAGLSTEITKVFTTASPVRLVYLVDGADPKQTKLFDREPSSYTSRWKLAGDLMDVVVGVGTAPRLGNLRPFERVDSSLSTGELTIPLQVNDGAEIYTTIFAQDTTGGSYQYFSSHGMVVDRSAPVRGWVTVGNRMVHQMVVPRQAAISASWTGFSDAESDIDRYEYCLDLNDDVDNPLCSISGWVNVWKQLRVIDAPIVGSVLPIGQHCFVKVRATNMVGLSVIATSPPFTVDPAAPQGGRASISFPGVDSGNSMSPIALDGSQLYLDRSCVNVSWSSFTGNVIKYRVALLQEPGNIVVPFRSVGVMTSWTFAGLNLTSRGPGSEYRAAVQAWTAAGIYSEITTPFRVVDGRPGPGTLTVVSASGSSVLFYVTGFADPNPLKVQYEISVGKNPYGAEGPPVIRLDCGSTICSYTYEWTLGSAPPGTIFYLSVRAFNEAGLFSDPATTPVMLPVPMADGLSAGRGTRFLWNVTASNPFLNAYQTDAILTGGNLTLFLVNSTAVLPVTCNFNKTISTTGKLAVVGDNFKDPVVTCPAPYNEVSEGGYLTLVVQINNVLSNPVVFWRRAPGVFSVCAYFIGSTDANSRCIAAPAIKTGNLAPTINPATINAHPLSSTVRVNTERLVPLGTSQYVGLTPVTASWDGTFVAEAGKVMVSYRLLLGTSPATAMNGSWLSTTATTASLTGDLVAGVPYFASVIAFDEVGLATIEYSSALISDISPPDVGTVHIGKSYYNQDITWQATSLSLDFFLENWSDHISGIRNFAYRVCEARQCGQRIVVGITVSVTASVALEPGVAYWVSVQATNGAGLTSQWVNSSVVTVDEQPPQITSISFSGVNGAFAATPGTNLTLNWQATRLYAPIQEYAVQIGTTRGGGQLLAPTSVGGMSSFSLSGLALQHNTVIYATVRAKSSNGLDSVAISDGLHLDFTPPRVIGMVKVLDATSYVMALGLVNVSMSWKDVFSEPESAIVSYQYAIGTPGLPSLYTNGFLDAGTSVSAVYECFPADDSHFVVTVRATNVPGATVTATSGLVMKSATAPTAFTLSILNEDTVTVNGTCFIPSSIARFSLDNLADPVSGIQHVQIQLIDAANGVAIQDWFSIDDLAFLSLEAADSEWLLRPLKINARAFNYVGLISLASSETFILTERIPL